MLRFENRPQRKPQPQPQQKPQREPQLKNRNSEDPSRTIKEPQTLLWKTAAALMKNRSRNCDKSQPQPLKNQRKGTASRPQTCDSVLDVIIYKILAKTQLIQ